MADDFGQQPMEKSFDTLIYVSNVNDNK